MTECIDILILVTETLTVLIFMHISFNRKIYFDKYMLGILAVSGVVYLLINKRQMPQICSIAVYALIWLYCYLKFKYSVAKTLLRFLFGFIMAAFSEALMVFASVSLEFIYNDKIILLLISLISFIIAMAIYTAVVLRPPKLKHRTDRSLLLRIILLGSVFAALIIDYYKNSAVVRIYTIVMIAFVIMIYIYTYMLEKSEKEVEIKNIELELQDIYGGAYEELLAEVRRKQHDFKNQLGAIYSMHLVADSLDNLVKMQAEYGDRLLEGYKYDSILTCCSNSVLAGYIYYRCISCEKNGIEVLYNIKTEAAECGLALYEIIEILGILIDNACENIVQENTEIKSVKLDIIENEKEVRFAVSNPAKYLTSAEIGNLFKKGYSTKGKNRGIGLARVHELLTERETDIKVRNYTNSDTNWLEFEIISKKQ